MIEPRLVDEPTTWLCPVVEDDKPCLEVLREATSMVDREVRGLCLVHGIFRWGEVGGWIR